MGLIQFIMTIRGTSTSGGGGDDDWILSGGVWNDSEPWNDDENWID